MIIGFKHKGLRDFYETGSTKGIKAVHADKLEDILNMFDLISNLNEIGEQFRLHRLKGKLSKYHAVDVDKNWRVIFQFRDNGFDLIDYLDYH